MPHRPSHCILITVNPDNSGSIKQFDTYSEGVAAFEASVAGGGTAYLYPSARKSLSSLDLGADVPAYNNGATYGTGALVRLNNKVYRLINFIGAGGYGPISHPSLWTEEVFLPQPQAPISSTGLTANGQKGMSFTTSQNLAPSIRTLVSIECQLKSFTDLKGVPFTAAVSPLLTWRDEATGNTSTEVAPDGSAGTCFWPQNCAYEIVGGEEGSPITLSTRKIYSLDYSGTVWGEYYSATAVLHGDRELKIADGAGGVLRFEQERGIPNFEVGTDVWEQYVNGDTPYSMNHLPNKMGQPVPNAGYLITYKVSGDDRIHSGRWFPTIQNYPANPSVKWTFVPEDAEQPPPPPCSITKEERNETTGVIEEICDPDIVYPFTVNANCEDPVTVTIEGETITVGTNTKKGMDNGYGDVVWGACTGMVYTPNGTQIKENESYRFYSDGAGYYYSESKNPSNCPPNGEMIEPNRTDLTVTIEGVGTYTIGYHYEDIVADGNCGTQLNIGNYYQPNGTLITNTSENNYYSNGSGGYYSEPRYPAYGTLLSVDSTPLVVYVDNVQDATLGTNRVYHYADGQGGEYTEFGTNYIETGTFLFNAGGYTYRSYGEGSWTKSPIEYPPQGEFAYSEQNGDYTVTIEGAGTYKVGEYGTNSYHDGMGGYTSQSWDTYYPHGTLITNYGGNNYYCDGSGYYYSEGDGSGGGGSEYPSYGTELSSDSGSSTLDWSAPDGQTGTWTYSSWGSTTYADGMGGTYTNSGGWNATSGDLIYSGSYSYENGTDEYGNPVFSAGTFYLRSDGMSGYYTDYN